MNKQDKMLIRRLKQKDSDQIDAVKKYKNAGDAGIQQIVKESKSIDKKFTEDNNQGFLQGTNAQKGKTYGAKHPSGSKFSARTKHKDFRKTGMFNVSRPSQRSKK